MDNIQKKLVQGAFKLWEAAQKDGERFHIQDIPDVGCRRIALIRSRQIRKKPG